MRYFIEPVKDSDNKTAEEIEVRRTVIEANHTDRPRVVVVLKFSSPDREIVIEAGEWERLVAAMAIPASSLLPAAASGRPR